jgi:hypothetical protein
LFLSGLKEALKTRGARVKKKDLRSLFCYIGDLCPWFPLEGTIDGKRWLRVGDCLKDYYESFGPEKVPVTAFSYWNLINDILKSAPFDNGTLKLVKIGQNAMQTASRPPTGVSDGGGPTDAVKHLQIIELLKPQIPELTYHPLMLPKSQIPDLDPNTLDILGSTFSLLNTSNPTLAKDCWLCMTTGAIMPMAIPVNSTVNNQDTCQSGLPFKVQPMDAPTVCLQGRMQNNSYDIDVGVSSFGNCSSVLNYSSPTPALCPPNGTVFLCGGNSAFPRLPANWTGGCVVALLLPDITVVSGDEPLPIPSLDTLIKRHKRAIQALPLLASLGITAAIGTGTAGLGTAIHSYRRLSQQLIDDVQTLSGTIKDLQDQIDSLAEVVLQNRRGLDLLTANQGGICLALGERCCFYANKSGIVRTKIKQLQEDLEKRRRELFENPLWTGLNGILPYLLPLLGPLLGLLLIVIIGPCIINRLIQFIKEQINTLASKPIQVHYHRLDMEDRAPETFLSIETR